MIVKLENQNRSISEKMMQVFHDSYSVEAKLLDATDFPPLKRKLEDYINSKNKFFGYFQNEVLAGVIEIAEKPEFIHIQSLVVDPNYFRNGIGKSLMNFTLNNIDTSLFIVETGLKNEPAIQLYEKLGFMKIKEWDTEHGIRKISLEKRNSE